TLLSIGESRRHYNYLSAQQRVKRRKSSRIKQSRSRRNRNPTIVVVPRLKKPCYAKTSVYPLPDSTIDKLFTWHASKYHDILNCNGKVTNQYKGGIYVEIIRNGQ
ncbi:5477_t:CDS:2, partial [Gigaspora margarita]